MTKLLRTGGFDPLEVHYEAAPNDDFDPLPAEALDALLAFDTPAPVSPQRGNIQFERGKIDFAHVRREHLLDDVGPRILEGWKQQSATTAKAACPVHGDAAEHGNLCLHFGPHIRSGTWICSSCRAHGDVLDLVCAAMGFDEPREALMFLDGGQPLDASRREALRRRAEENDRRASAVPSLNLDLTAFAKAAYERLRGQENPARAYLRSRGLEAAIGRYGLGYAARDLAESLLPQTWDYEREEARPALGFYGRIIIPYRQPDGRVPVVNARKLTDGKPKYLKPSAGTQLGNSNARPYRLETALLGDLPIVITEGELDCMSLGLSANDLVGECAIPGVNCFTEQDAALLSGRRVILITDNDDAGRRAEGPLRERLETSAGDVKVLKVPEPGQDVNDMLQQHGQQAVRSWMEAAMRRRRLQ